MKPLAAKLLGNCLKVWTPCGGYFAVISVADVKEIAQVLAVFVTIGCTIWVSKSTVEKNRRQKNDPHE
jgi:ATP/ADP translocase